MSAEWSLPNDVPSVPGVGTGGQSWRRAATRAAAWLGGALGDLRRGVLGDLRARLAPADALARTRLAETLAHQLTQTVE